MKVLLVVILVLVGSVYCRSLPVAPPQPSSIDVALLNGNPVELVRKARQFGKNINIF